MSSRSKRQQTAAKRTREQLVKERRALKQEKKQAAAAARSAEAVEGAPPADLDEETPSDSAEQQSALPDSTEPARQ